MLAKADISVLKLVLLFTTASMQSCLVQLSFCSPSLNSMLLTCVCVSCRWFCHMDDDNYVILPSLLRLLSSYHHSQDVYLGRPSLDHPIEAAERVKSDGSVSQLTPCTLICLCSSWLINLLLVGIILHPIYFIPISTPLFNLKFL